jgi:hypothetical protein
LADWAIYRPDRKFVTANAHYIHAKANLHLPIVISTMLPEKSFRGLGLPRQPAKHEQEILDSAAGFVNSKVFPRGQQGKQSIRASKVVVILNTKVSPRLAREWLEKGVVTVSIHKLENILAHIPDSAGIDKARMMGILEHAKKPLVEKYTFPE